MFTTLIVLATVLLTNANREINIYNRCPFPTWVGINGIGSFEQNKKLNNEQSYKIFVDPKWNGTIFPKTHCDANGRACQSGDLPYPRTTANFQMDFVNDQDLYDVSLVQGYNVPVFIEPYGGTECTRAGGCFSDVNQVCPSNLVIRRDGFNIACKSPCSFLATDKECCTGPYSTPDKCFRSEIASIFKEACPTAFSYKFDDATSTFACQKVATYVVQFC